jgi:hypothetical protein
MKKALLVLFFLALMGAMTIGRDAPAVDGDRGPVAFVTWVHFEGQAASAAMLVDSIRAWGGEYRNAPIFVMLTDPENERALQLKQRNVELVSVPLPESVRNYPFAAKAFAAARAEAMIAGKFRSLAWFDPETLLLNPPRELDLNPGVAAAVAPVNLSNIGQGPDEPVDAFWGPIYKRCGADVAGLLTVETKVDGKKVRVWLNCGMFAVRPERGLCREWALVLEEFLNDLEFQRSSCGDARHRTFLHQAVISTLIASRLKRDETRMLSDGYNYPLFTHAQGYPNAAGSFRLPPAKRARKLADLTTVFLERLFTSYRDWLERIPPAAPAMKEWLLREYERTHLKTAGRETR